MKTHGDAATPQRTNAISRQLEGELIVYALETHHAHSLNRTAAEVWKSCDGKTTVTEMVTSLGNRLPGIDEQVLLVTLAELQKAGLLVRSTFSLSQASSRSRRDVLRKLGKVAAIAFPIVTSIVVPTPSMALSCFPLGHSCTKNSDCCSNPCGIVGITPICL
jgi:hypothetical protein